MNSFEQIDEERCLACEKENTSNVPHLIHTCNDKNITDYKVTDGSIISVTEETYDNEISN